MALGLGLGLPKNSNAVGAFGVDDVPGLISSVQVTRAVELGLVWKDAGKTVPAEEDGDEVKVITDPETMIDYVAPSDAARGLLWDEGEGKWGLFYDGVDDCYNAAVGVWDNAPHTLYALASPAATGATGQGMIQSGSGAGRLAYGWMTTGKMILVQTGIAGYALAVLAADDDYHRWSWRSPGISGDSILGWTGRKNGTDEARATTINGFTGASTTGVRVGEMTTEFFSGRLALLVLASGILSETVLDKLDAFALTLLP